MEDAPEPMEEPEEKSTREIDIGVAAALEQSEVELRLQKKKLLNESL